jgi:hypothetical protein
MNVGEGKHSRQPSIVQYKILFTWTRIDVQGHLPVYLLMGAHCTVGIYLPEDAHACYHHSPTSPLSWRSRRKDLIKTQITKHGPIDLVSVKMELHMLPNPWHLPHNFG